MTRHLRQPTGVVPLYVRPFRVPELFGISRATLYRWQQRGLIRLHKRGAQTFVRVADLVELIEGTGGPTGGPTD